MKKIDKISVKLRLLACIKLCAYSKVSCFVIAYFSYTNR